MAFKSISVAVANVDTEVVECAATTEGAAVLLIANKSGAATTFTLKMYRQETGETEDIATDVDIGANALMKFPAPISLEAGDKILAVAPANDNIVVSGTYTFSTDNTPVLPFDGMGEYDPDTNYPKNAVVSFVASTGRTNSYLARQPSIGKDPELETAYWMILARQGIQGLGDMSGANNLSELTDVAAARTKLGLGDAATKNVGTAAGTVAAGDDPRIVAGGTAVQPGALGDAAAKNTGTGANTVAAGDDARITGAAQKAANNAWTKTQSPSNADIDSATAWDATAIQEAVASVNGALFTIANPSKIPVRGYVSVVVYYETAHSIAWGNKFLGLTGITPTAAAGALDHFVFWANGNGNDDAGALTLVGYRLNCGA